MNQAKELSQEQDQLQEIVGDLKTKRNEKDQQQQALKQSLEKIIKDVIEQEKLYNDKKQELKQYENQFKELLKLESQIQTID